MINTVLRHTNKILPAAIRTERGATRQTNGSVDPTAHAFLTQTPVHVCTLVIEIDGKLG
jgi:hypothetical protein